jgi:hypothetical protein
MPIFCKCREVHRQIQKQIDSRRLPTQFTSLLQGHSTRFMHNCLYSRINPSDAELNLICQLLLLLGAYPILHSISKVRISDQMNGK